ncbi:Manganese efflux system protein MneP [subsurface metagenome]
MDERPEPAVLARIKTAVLEVREVKAIDNIKAHRRGSTFTIDIEVAVDSNLTVEQGHQVASKVKNKLLSRVEHVQEVMVHVNPYQQRQTLGRGYMD